MYLNDVYVLKLSTLKWKRKNCKGTPPLGRYGHTALIHEGKMLIFGGRGEKGAYYRDTMSLDLKKKKKKKKPFTFGGIFSVSRQILPAESILGWYIGVTKRTFGGSNGYLGNAR